MTLRRRLGLRYAAIVVVCLLLLGGLAHHEFVVEPRVRNELGLPKPSGSAWGEYAEMVFHGTIPLVLGVGWWLMRRTLTPIDDLATAVERVHAGNLKEPLQVNATADEVATLTRVFNAMAGRLDASFRHIREFTLHASHELKTPLTVMRAEAENLLRADSGLTSNQRTWVQSQLDEIQRLVRIVDALALLAKADAGLVALARERVQLDDLVRECFADACLLAEPADVQVRLEACEAAAVQGDRDRLRQLLLNLSDNAIKYNQPGGWLALSLRRVGSQAELVLTNTGPGISPDLLPRVFDRFVRGSSPRTRGVEGSGLGLSICQWIAQAHGGSIQLVSDPDKTTTVTVRLPVAAA